MIKAGRRGCRGAARSLEMYSRCYALDPELEGELRREVLTLLTAARRYGFAHSGDLPARAELLVPNYLKSVPLDPFTRAALQIESEAIKASRGEQAWITLPTAPNQP